MLNTLVAAVENPVRGIRVLEVPQILQRGQNLTQDSAPRTAASV